MNYCMIKKVFFVFIAVANFLIVSAQPPTEIDTSKEGDTPIDTLENKLEFWEDSIATFSSDLQKKIIESERLDACYKMIPLFAQALKEPGSFEYPFDNLEFISKAYAPDNSFRIMTWLVRLDNAGYRYFGTLQMNNSENKLIPFYHIKKPIENLGKVTLGLDKWYGAIYYNVSKVSHNKTDYYMLYGWDGNDFLSNKKVLDVLYFEDGKPQLGAPIITYKSQMQQGVFNRMFLEYNSAATVNLNYDEDLEMIVYDHIGPEDGKSFGMYPTYIPDGTYEALKFENGIWQYVEKVFHETQDEAPIPSPLFKDKGPLPVELPKNKKGN